MGPTNPIPKELAVATLLQSVFSGFLSTTCQSNHLPIWSILSEQFDTKSTTLLVTEVHNFQALFCC
jgi:hypothetical protein